MDKFESSTSGGRDSDFAEADTASTKSQDLPVRAPLIDKQDIKLVAQQQMKLSQKQILKMHVKNHDKLSLKQKRKVLGHIQA